MIILNISEEYGCNHWYAVLSDERYEQLKNEWLTIRGLNCLVPVRFLIPEALNFPLLPEYAQFADEKYLEANNIQVINAHIHQSDDSFLEGVDGDIPEGEFEFKGIRYSEDQVYEIFHQYRDEDDKIESSSAPNNLSFGLDVTEILEWPDDVALPVGWIRTKDKIVKDSSTSH